MTNTDMRSTIDDGGCAWPIAAMDDDALTLTDNERTGLSGLARAVAARHGERAERWHLDSTDLMLDCDLTMRREGPFHLVHRLSGFRSHANADGALLVRNLPVDDHLPPTPVTGDLSEDWDSLPTSTIVQLMVMSVLGDVISYADEKHGRIIQDVVAVAGAEGRQENNGSCLLELHTEDGFHPERPRYLSLLGLRGDRDGRAWTVSSGARRALALLDGGTRATLARPIYQIRLSSSFAGARTDLWSVPQAVLQGSAADPELCVDFHALSTPDPGGARALVLLRRALLQGMRGHRLEAGDLLVVDNGKAVHGRTAFTAHHDGMDRWLRRCFAVADLRRSAQRRISGSRVVDRVVADPGTSPAEVYPLLGVIAGGAVPAALTTALPLSVEGVPR